MPIQSYKDLIVWQKSIELVALIYVLTKEFPKDEVYGITSQIKRSAVSIPSNIAEGKIRGSKKEFTQFLRIAYGSGAELETQIIIIERLGFSSTEQTKNINTLLEEIMRMLNVMINKLTTIN